MWRQPLNRSLPRADIGMLPLTKNYSLKEVATKGFIFICQYK
jgi:hypothetical protein